MKHFLLLFGLFFSLTAWADSWVQITESTRDLTPGQKYYVSSNVTINSGNGAALRITGSGSAAVTIEIHDNCTLTVTGESGSYGHVAYPAIEVPAGKTLIICGGGSLVASGGNCGQGDSGWSGSDGLCDRNSSPMLYAGGYGARGGNGGSGGAPAIGGKSGAGGVGGASTPYSDNEDGKSGKFEYEGDTGYSGNNGSDGKLGEAMGKVYILGKVQLTLTKGKIYETASSGGGSGTGSSWSYMFWGRKFAGAGGGGGGGAGGNGLAAEYEIGAGGKGAGGGASGSSGARFYRNLGGRTFEWHLGRGGNGGSGVPAGKGGADGVKNNDSEFNDCKLVYDHSRASGGNIPSGNPDHGKLYVNSFYADKVGGRTVIRQLTADLTTGIPEEAIFTIMLKKPNTLFGGIDQIKYFDGMQMPEVIDVPQGSNDKLFAGYYDHQGKLIYDASGKLITNETRDMFINREGKLYIRHTGDIILTAAYRTSRVIHVHHVFGDVNAKELAADNLSDEKKLQHPEYSNRNKTFDYTEDLTFTIISTETETVKATGNTDELTEDFANHLIHSDIQGSDTKEVTLTNEGGDQTVYFFHRFKLTDVNWSYSMNGVNHDLNDGLANTIMNDADKYKQGIKARYYSQIIPPIFKNDHGYQHNSWTVNGRKEEYLPTFVTKDANNFEAQFEKMKFNVALQNAEQTNHIVKFDGIQNGEYEYESKLDFEVIPETGYGISSIKTWNYADTTIIDSDVLQKETVNGTVRYKGHTSMPACDIFVKPEVERLVNHLYKTTHSIDDPDYYKKGYVMYFTVKHDEDGSEIADKAYTDNYSLCDDVILADTLLKYRIGDPVHLAVMDAAVMDNQRSVHPTVKVKYLTESEMKDIKLEDVIDLNYQNNDYSVIRRYKYASPAVNAFFNIGYESYPVHELTYDDKTDKKTSIKRLYRDSQMQYDNATLAGNPLKVGYKDIATFMLDKSVGNNVVTASYTDAEGHEHALYVNRRVGKGLFNQLRYYFFTMPNANVKIEVKNPSSANVADNIAYAINECSGIGTFLAEAPDYATEGQYVTFHANIPEDKQIVTNTKIISADGELIEVIDYDPATATGTFIMPASDVTIVINNESEYHGDDLHIANIEWNDKYYMPYVYSETSLLPPYVQPYVVTSLTENDGIYNLNLSKFAEHSLPSCLPVILCSDRRDINIITLGRNAYMDVDNMLTFSDQDTTADAMLSTDAMNDYDAILKLTMLDDGVAFTLSDGNIYFGDVILPVRKEWFTSLPDGAQLAAYLVRKNTPGGIEQMTIQLRPAVNGVFNLSGQKVAESAEQMDTLPLGIYIVNAKRIIKK